MQTTRYYDRQHNRLVYVGAASDDDYWDSAWSNYSVEQVIRRDRPTPEQANVLRVTRRYLPQGSRVLEGGCGMGDKAYVLRSHGYDVVGVDYAQKTVARVKRAVPELSVCCEDIRQLSFRDGFFDGYWSLGVIEHFYGGYDEVAREMHRVLRDGGVLFLTVPSLSRLRALKARAGIFPAYRESEATVASFYQFALDPSSVRKHFAHLGFDLAETHPLNGIKGLMDEVPFLTLPLKVLYKVAQRPTERLTRPFAHHATLFVFRKRPLRGDAKGPVDR